MRLPRVRFTVRRIMVVAAAVRRMLGDVAIRRAMGEAAHRRFWNEFAWDSAITRFEDALQIRHR